MSARVDVTARSLRLFEMILDGLELHAGIMRGLKQIDNVAEAVVVFATGHDEAAIERRVTSLGQEFILAADFSTRHLTPKTIQSSPRG
jgi:hypothetical protein